MKTARVLRALYNKNLDRHQFVVEFVPPIDVSKGRPSPDVVLLPKRVGRPQLVRYALVSTAGGRTVGFEVRNASYELSDPWGDVFAESAGDVSTREFLAALGYIVEDSRSLLSKNDRGTKKSTLKTVGLVVGGVALVGGLAALASSKK
jgi:hypothetical protein